MAALGGFRRTFDFRHTLTAVSLLLNPAARRGTSILVIPACYREQALCVPAYSLDRVLAAGPGVLRRSA